MAMILLTGVLVVLAMNGGDPAQAARDRMVDEQLIPRGITDKAVLAAMRTVPRHQFVPAEMAPYAYNDRPLPIGFDQTISQPAIVARMTELAAVRKGQRVLEIGTGSGYQAAVLAALGAEVYTIEIVEQLGKRAATDLARWATRGQDPHRRRLPGWPEAAPFDAIIVTAAPAQVPEPLKQQLKQGGRLVIPVGDANQELILLTRTDTGFRNARSCPWRSCP